MIQSQALQILKTGANVFLTGEPGAGKTHLVNEYVAYLRARGIEPSITASTGIAATHIGGMTIHSWSGIGIKARLGKGELNKIASTPYVAKRIKHAKVLIIDEVSMLPPNTLSMVDAICRAVKKNENPFGGIQVVFVGDFFQLPPVVRRETDEYAQELYDEESSARFAFGSPAWANADLTVCYLTEQHRQEEGDFLALLSAIRGNSVTTTHLSHMKSRKIDYSAAPSDAPKLFSHNADVDHVNNGILAKLPGAPRMFNMSSRGGDALVSSLIKGCLSPEVLCLKEGAAIMFTKNNPKEGFANGTLGIVSGFNAQSGFPLVTLRNGKRVDVGVMDWAIEDNGEIRAMITQLPLRLAWAITVHKSQGMSLDEATIDLSNVFEFGQGYVALSRVRNLSGLYLLGWNERALQVHPEVSEQDEKFRAHSEQASRAFDNMSEEEITALHAQFIHLCGGKLVPESRAGEPRTASERMAPRRKNRKGETLVLIRSGKTIAEVAKESGLTEGTIMKHLEDFRTAGKLEAQDIAHLAYGFEESLTDIHNAFRELETDKLTPVFEQLDGKYSYDQLRIARMMREKS